MTDSSSRYPLWTRDFIITTLANLFLFTSFQMLLPTLPLYIEQLGGDSIMIGITIGVFTLFALLVRPIAGRFTNDFGHRPILMLGLILFMLAALGYYWMSTALLVLFMRIPHGIGWGMSTTTIGTIIADLVPHQRRGEGMGYYGLSSNLAMALAPLFGIEIMNQLGFTYVFFISTGLAFIALLLTFFIDNASLPQNLKGPKEETFLQSVIEKRALFPTLLAVFLGLTYGGIVTFITLFGSERNIPNVGWFFLANAGIVMLVRPFAGKLYDRKGHPWVLLPAAFFSITGLLLLSYATGTTGLVLAALFYGTGFGMIQPALQAWTISRVPPEKRGVATGTYFSGFDLGIGAGSIAFGMLATLVGYGVMYRYSSILMGIYLVVYVGYLVKGKQKGSQ